eukprot:g1096.t1
MSSSLGIQFCASSVGSAPTQISDSISLSTDIQSTEAISNETTSQFPSDWITSFLTEVKSILPYQLPHASATNSVFHDSQDGVTIDWEGLFCQISQPLTLITKDWKTSETIKALRMTSSEFRKVFSWGVRSLTINECQISDVVNSLNRAFGNVRVLHITRNSGRIPRSLGKCTQLREISIEPVNLGLGHETESAIFGQLTNLETLRLWGPVVCTSKTMESFQALHSLKKLSLGSNLQITGRDLVHLTQCVKLEFLQLRGCHSMDDFGLNYIGLLTQLSELELSVGRSSPISVCRVSPRGMQSIGKLPRLRSIRLENFSSFTSRHLIALSTRTTLMELCLDFPRAICSMDFMPLRNLERLVHLRIRNVLVIDDHNIQVCEKLKQLEILHLGTCTLATDASAFLLSTLLQLIELRIDEYPLLTESGLEALIESPSLRLIKVTGIYSITNEEAQELALNNSFSLDSESWSNQTINIHKTRTSIHSNVY